MEWRELLARLRQDERCVLFGAPGALCMLLLAIGAGPMSVVLCAVCVSLGYLLAEWSSRSQGEFLSPLILNLLSSSQPRPPSPIPPSPTDSPYKERKPWNDVVVPKAVNEAVEGLVEEMLEQYVNHWYGGGISHDRAFLNEIRYQVRFMGVRLLTCVQSVDLSPFILERLLPPTTVHVRRVLDAEMKCEKSSTPSTLERRIAERLGGVHFALKSRQNEANYLRQIVEHVLPHLLDERRLSGRAHDDESPSHARRNTVNKRPWPSHPVRHFIRELLTHSVLLPLLDIIADPDTINHLLCLLFDPSPLPEPSQTTEPRKLVIFLRGLTESAADDIPDSLLQLKLSDILVDARLFSMFRLYLGDVGGPINELQFLADTKRVHEMMQKKEGSSSESTFDIWQIYTRFIHESAPERIPFSEDTVRNFREAVEGNDLERLDRIVEKTYQEVYSRMQWEYVMQFWQSETFLGHLCGSPPDVMEDWDAAMKERRGTIEGGEETTTTNKAISITQLKNQLVSVIWAPVEEEEGKEEKINDSRESSVEGSFEGPVPSIDVSFAEDALAVEDSPSDLLSPSSTRSLSDLIRESSPSSEMSSGDAIPEGATTVGETPQLIMDTDRRDLNRWKVTIPTVVPVKDPANGRWFYAYNIDVYRTDAEEHETQQWSIVRRYSEFYVLESKLREFHADALKYLGGLAPRKMFVPRTREFVDSYRPNFAVFLAGLCKQTILARSDLLFAFLTSGEEFRETITLSELNPLRIVRKMPSKLTREKGQNLKPFLLSLMANVFAESGSYEGDRRDEETEDDSVSCAGSAPFSLYSTVYGKNLEGITVGKNTEVKKSMRTCEHWTRSVFDSLLLLSLPSLPSLLSSLPSGLRSLSLRLILFLLHLCAQRTFDEAVTVLLNRVLERAFEDSSMVACVQLLQQSLFCREETIATEQEKALRMELAERRTHQFIEDSLPYYVLRCLPLRSVRNQVSRILHSLQFPCLNKQLTYELLDVIVADLFPFGTVSHPLEE